MTRKLERGNIKWEMKNNGALVCSMCQASTQDSETLYNYNTVFSHEGSHTHVIKISQIFVNCTKLISL